MEGSAENTAMASKNAHNNVPKRGLWPLTVGSAIFFPYLPYSFCSGYSSYLNPPTIATRGLSRTGLNIVSLLLACSLAHSLYKTFRVSFRGHLHHYQVSYS